MISSCLGGPLPRLAEIAKAEADARAASEPVILLVQTQTLLRKFETEVYFGIWDYLSNAIK